MNKQRIIESEIVIVGGGLTGMWAARALTTAGKNVLLIEKGPTSHPQGTWDGSLENRDWMVNRYRNTFFGPRRVAARCAGFEPTTAHLYAIDKDHPYESVGRFFWIRGYQLGGRSFNWGRTALRMGQDACSRPGVYTGGCWPIDAGDLAPNYDAVEQVMGLLSGVEDVPWLPRGNPIVPLSEPKSLMSVAEKWRRRWPSAHVFAPRLFTQENDSPPRLICEAQDTGRLTVLSNTAAYRFVGGSGEVKAVECRAKDETIEVRGKVFFTCASAIESVRLLLNSPCDGPSGLGNDHGHLGTGLMDHCFSLRVGSRPNEGESGGLDLKSPGMIDNNDALGMLAFAPEDTEHSASAYQLRNLPRAWAAMAFGRCEPHPDNRIELGDQVDMLGIPCARIHFHRSETDRQVLEQQRRDLDQIFATIGSRTYESWWLRAFWPLFFGPQFGQFHSGLAIHECGGAAMGNSPETSVLDSHNRLWNHPNVYVTDASCFPTSPWQNPTATSMALTNRAVTHYLATADELRPD